jgi:hypothetical protein
MADKKTGGMRKLAIVRPSVIATTFSSRSIKYAKLQNLNFGAAAAYAGQALLLLLIGHSTKLPVTFSYIATDPLQTAAQGRAVLATASHHWLDANVRMMLIGVLLLAAVFHLAFATVARERYERALGSKMNDLRWWLAALTGGVLAVLLGMLVGMTDVAVLAALFGLSILAWLGMLAIEANQRLWPWVLPAAIAATTALALGLCYMVAGSVYGTALPGYVYGLFGLTVLGMVATVANLVLQIRGQGRWRDYLFAELVYAVVGFAGISVFTWTVFAGVLS